MGHEARARAGGQARPSVGLAVDDPGLRLSLAESLRAGGAVIRESVASVEDLLASSRSPLDCMVVSVPRPNRPTLATVEAATADRPDVRWVLVCERAGAGEVSRAIEAGVDGVLYTGEHSRTVASVVAAVMAGQVSVPQRHRGEVTAQILTLREKQIIGHVAIGMTNAQIAQKLYLAESTVKSHLSSAFRKLNVSSRSEAVSLISNGTARRGPLGPGEPVAAEAGGRAGQRAQT